MHDAKKIAKCEAHLMFPSLGWFTVRHGSALDDPFALLCSIEAVPRIGFERSAKS